MAPFDSLLLLYHYKNEGKVAPVVNKACSTLKRHVVTIMLRLFQFHGNSPPLTTG
jgi:hypothetical protein